MQFSDRVKKLEGNAIREIFKLLDEPGVISFAGGFPALDSFPVAEIEKISAEILSSSESGKILQYGATEGYAPLVESALGYVKRSGVIGERNNALIISGGQQGIDLTFKCFLNKGDKILVENPTYLACLHILKTYESKAVGVKSDDDGINTEDLEEKIKSEKPKIIYVVPNFSNPTGKTLSLEKRKKIAELASKYDIMVLEDDPYGELRYKGERLPAIKSFDKTGNVLYVTSFSKTISPGLRTAIIVGREDVIRKLTIGKQATDVHTSTLSQAIVDKYLRKGLLQPHLDAIIPQYAAKKCAMQNAIAAYMPKGILFTNPDGGLFIWGEFEDKSVDTVAIFKDVVQKTHCAYVPGKTFYANEDVLNSFRLNFSNATIDQIEQGIKAMAGYFTALLK